VAVAFDCARGMQDGEQLERGVLGEPVHHRGALPLACGDEVAVVRHVADLGLGDGLDDGGCWGGHGVSCGWSATSTVGVCARRAASPLWVAPWPGVGSVADASIEASLDAVLRLGEGCYGVARPQIARVMGRFRYLRPTCNWKMIH